MTPTNEPRHPLAGVRVLDLTVELGVAGTRLLAVLGADVLRPELPDGDPVRVRPPLFPRDGGDRSRAERAESLTHLLYNAGKHSVVVDWRTDEGRARLHSLVVGSDITICSRGRALLETAGFDLTSFSTAYPATALVVLEPFPADSDFQKGAYQDLTLSAAGGFAWLCGHPDGPPEHPKGNTASTYAGLGASLAGLAGLASRDLGGRAGVFELTAQEAVAFSTLQHGDPNPYLWYGELPSRITWGKTTQRGLYRCADGRFVSFVMLGVRLLNLVQWLSEAGVSDRFLAPEWQDNDYYNEHLDELTAAIAALCRLFSVDEIVSNGRDRLLTVIPVKTVDELLDDPQLTARGMFVPVADSAVPLRIPRAPMVFSRCSLPVPRRAPALGECPPGILDQWTERPRPADEPSDRLPLSGLRVADFTWMLAGPLASRFLADLGADVIRIESHVRRDLTREIGTQPPGFQSLDTNSHQHHAGANKRSIALDLRHDEAVAIARRLIASSDVVLDNYRPGTMAKWGLSPDELLAERPDLIVVTMPAVGSTGPHSQFGAFGNGIAAYAGLNSITGFPENPPFGVGPVIGDFFGPMFAVQAVLAAYHHRALTGEGQHVDCAMFESCICLTDTAIVDFQLNHRLPVRMGNRDEWMSPHGIFPCDGPDDWVAIAIASDTQWLTLCRALSFSEADAERYATLSERRRDREAVEHLVAAATGSYSKWQLARDLQKLGVPAAPVEHVRDHLYDDPGLVNRFARIVHPYGPTFLVQNQFIRPEGQTVPNRRAPMIGEHTDEVLRTLGYSEDEISEFYLHDVLN